MPLTTWTSSLLLGLSLAAPAAAGPPEPGRDLLSFTNGDTLHGEIVAASPAQGLRWLRRDAQDEIVFPLAGLAQAGLAAASNAPVPPPAACLVRLSNGDELPGSGLSLEGGVLALDTAFAGTLRLRRSMVQAISPRGAASFLYRGPLSPGEWAASPPECWEWRDRALRSLAAGTAGAFLPLPDRVSIEFRVRWATAQPQFALAFFTDSLQTYSGNSYAVRISSSRAGLYRYAGGHSSLVGSGEFDVPLGRSGADIQLLADRETASFHLLADGRPACRWTDDAGFAGKGTGVVFLAYSGFALQVSDIHVRPWFGVAPVTATVTGDCDRIEFFNGDGVSGALESVAGSNLTFRASFGPLAVPLARVRRVSLATHAVELARRHAEDVRVALRGEGIFTVRLNRIESGRLTGISENLLDEPSLGLDAVSALEFNLYREHPVNRLLP